MGWIISEQEAVWPDLPADSQEEKFQIAILKNIIAYVEAGGVDSGQDLHTLCQIMDPLMKDTREDLKDFKDKNKKINKIQKRILKVLDKKYVDDGTGFSNTANMLKEVFVGSTYNLSNIVWGL